MISVIEIFQILVFDRFLYPIFYCLNIAIYNKISIKAEKVIKFSCCFIFSE